MTRKVHEMTVDLNNLIYQAIRTSRDCQLELLDDTGNPLPSTKALFEAFEAIEDKLVGASTRTAPLLLISVDS